MTRKMLLSILLICILTSCSSETKTQEEIGVELCNEVIRCFDEDDVYGLKELFCAAIQNNNNLDYEIKNAFDFFEGSIESYDGFSIGSGESVDDGVLMDSHIVPVINNIETDSGNIYKITFLSYIVLEKNEQYEGINYLIVRDYNGSFVMIGDYIV